MLINTSPEPFTNFGASVAEDVAVFGDIVKSDGDLLRNARLLHRNAVERGGAGHRLFRVRDDDELCPGQKLLQHGDEPLDVRGFVVDDEDRDLV